MADYTLFTEETIAAVVGHEYWDRYARPLTTLNPFKVQLRSFYALTLYDLSESVIFTAQRIYERFGPTIIVPWLLALAVALRVTKSHYWQSIEQFTELLDSTPQYIHHERVLDAFRDGAACQRDPVAMRRLLRFCELFIFPIFSRSGFRIGAYELETAENDRKVRQHCAGALYRMRWMSDIGDLAAEYRPIIVDDGKSTYNAWDRFESRMGTYRPLVARLHRYYKTSNEIQDYYDNPEWEGIQSRVDT